MLINTKHAEATMKRRPNKASVILRMTTLEIEAVALKLAKLHAKLCRAPSASEIETVARKLAKLNTKLNNLCAALKEV